MTVYLLKLGGIWMWDNGNIPSIPRTILYDNLCQPLSTCRRDCERSDTSEDLATTQRVHSSDTSHRHLMEPLYRMTRAGKRTPCRDCPRFNPFPITSERWCALTGKWQLDPLVCGAGVDRKQGQHIHCYVMTFLLLAAELQLSYRCAHAISVSVARHWPVCIGFKLHDEALFGLQWIPLLISDWHWWWSEPPFRLCSVSSWHKRGRGPQFTFLFFFFALLLCAFIFSGWGFSLFYTKSSVSLYLYCPC